MEIFGENPNITSKVKEAYKLTHIRPVFIPYKKRDYLNQYKKQYACGPLEFINLIKNAEFIMTDSFHASAFSIILNKPFLVFSKTSNDVIEAQNSRIYTLLNCFCLKDRIAFYNMPLNKDSIFNVSFSQCNSILDEKIKLSKAMFLKALCNDKSR